MPAGGRRYYGIRPAGGGPGGRTRQPDYRTAASTVTASQGGCPTVCRRGYPGQSFKLKVSAARGPVGPAAEAASGDDRRAAPTELARESEIRAASEITAHGFLIKTRFFGWLSKVSNICPMQILQSSRTTGFFKLESKLVFLIN